MVCAVANTVGVNRNSRVRSSSSSLCFCEIMVMEVRWLKLLFVVGLIVALLERDMYGGW